MNKLMSRRFSRMSAWRYACMALLVAVFGAVTLAYLIAPDGEARGEEGVLVAWVIAPALLALPGAAAGPTTVLQSLRYLSMGLLGTYAGLHTLLVLPPLVIELLSGGSINLLPALIFMCFLAWSWTLWWFAYSAVRAGDAPDNDGVGNEVNAATTGSPAVSGRSF